MTIYNFIFKLLNHLFHIVYKIYCLQCSIMYNLALQDNDTKVRDRVIYIDSIDSLYTNITG